MLACSSGDREKQASLKPKKADRPQAEAANFQDIIVMGIRTSRYVNKAGQAYFLYGPEILGQVGKGQRIGAG